MPTGGHGHVICMCERGTRLLKHYTKTTVRMCMMEHGSPGKTCRVLRLDPYLQNHSDKCDPLFLGNSTKNVM